MNTISGFPRQDAPLKPNSTRLVPIASLPRFYRRVPGCHLRDGRRPWPHKASENGDPEPADHEQEFFNRALLIMQALRKPARSALSPHLVRSIAWCTDVTDAANKIEKSIGMTNFPMPNRPPLQRVAPKPALASRSQRKMTLSGWGSRRDHLKAELPSGDFRFIALDVETACSDAASSCQIGIACVRSDNRIETFATLVNPHMRFDEILAMHASVKSVV